MSDEQKLDIVTDEMLERLDLLANRIVLRDGDSEIAVVPVLVAEISRQRRILAALREPSDGVVDAVADLGDSFEHLSRFDVRTAIRAAVAAAEQEVGP